MGPGHSRGRSVVTSGRPPLQSLESVDALVAIARKTQTSLPHLLLVGPPPAGILLRYVAEAIAAEMGVEIRTVNAHHIAHIGDLVAMLINLQDQPVLYIDDINALKPAFRTTLRDAMVEGGIDFIVGKGSVARTIRMTLMQFTIMGGVASRRALTSEAASYFAHHIDASALNDTWRQRIEAIRMQPPQPAARIDSIDPLLAEATNVVREYRHASVSLLQRRLSVDYSHATRLLDLLEERGVVGPSEDGRTRIVLDDSNPAALPFPHVSPHGRDDTTDDAHPGVPISRTTGTTPPLPLGTGIPTVGKGTPSVVPVPPRPQVARRIDVSARLLTWPRLCACCSRSATTEVAASYTRVSGQRVIRTNTRSWQVPVCGTCAEHGRIYSKTAGATGRAIAWSAVILLVSCVLGVVTPGLVVLGIIGAVTLSVVLLRSAQADRQAAEDMVLDTCCSADYPVVYQGWNGSVHSFYFRNGVYAQAFAAANAKKIL